eukprot:CAMPEP_0172663514 /NCGR_PEP_ID=MMETSP1074-20121228/5977_1 /TAXON_ID=2916 /ORGANISM="Ceratium fusus, Strain PA161109" /LENGTH=96 /DNA_ID=CAMNT_0013479525 /DNA_START=553 /DNA_END=843 /DNA_ORIENTATION=-
MSECTRNTGASDRTPSLCLTWWWNANASSASVTCMAILSAAGKTCLPMEARLAQTTAGSGQAPLRHSKPHSCTVYSPGVALISTMLTATAVPGDVP